MEEKYQVHWKSGRAHLSEDGRKTFCGRVIPFNGYSRDQDATAAEFINEVRPRCSGCKVGAQVAQLVDEFTDGQ